MCLCWPFAQGGGPSRRAPRRRARLPLRHSRRQRVRRHGWGSDGPRSAGHHALRYYRRRAVEGRPRRGPRSLAAGLLLPRRLRRHARGGSQVE
eukprot:1935871-Pyramimonas_sp.AAC.1